MTTTNSILTLKTFLSTHGGLQRPNRFLVTFPNLPPSLTTIYADHATNMFAYAVTIGARAIDGVADSLSGYGPGRTVPRSQKFPQGVLLTFPVTTNSWILKFFGNWFNSIYSGGLNAVTGTGTNPKPFYVEYYDTLVKNTTMNVSLLDLNGNPCYKYNFSEVYPLETLPLEFNSTNNNSFTLYSVLMMFRDFKEETLAPPSESGN